MQPATGKSTFPQEALATHWAALSPGEIEEILNTALNSLCEPKRFGNATLSSQGHPQEPSPATFPRLTSLSREELEAVLSTMAGELWI